MNLVSFSNDEEGFKKLLIQGLTGPLQKQVEEELIAIATENIKSVIKQKVTEVFERYNAAIVSVNKDFTADKLNVLVVFKEQPK